MKKKNYVSKAVMLGALLAPIGMPTVSVLAGERGGSESSHGF